MEFELGPVYAIARQDDSELTEQLILPFCIAEGLTFEDLRPYLRPDSFEVWKEAVGRWTHDKISNLHYGFIQRFDDSVGLFQRKRLVESSCDLLRLICPMRQPAVTNLQGHLQEDGTFEVKRFQLTNIQNVVDVPRAHLRNGVRSAHLELLAKLLPEFIRALNEEYWKFRIAIQLHNIAFLQVSHWKPKFLLLMTAIEAIYTTDTSREHQGAPVASARISWFLDGATKIYSDSNIEFAAEPCEWTVAEMLGELFTLRNLVAHGDRVPDEWGATFRRELGRDIAKADVLIEAASFILRSSLLKILSDGLLDHFKDSSASERYFEANGLIRSKLPKRPKPVTPSNAPMQVP